MNVRSGFGLRRPGGERYVLVPANYLSAPASVASGIGQGTFALRLDTRLACPSQLHNFRNINTGHGRTTSSLPQELEEEAKPTEGRVEMDQ